MPGERENVGAAINKKRRIRTLFVCLFGVVLILLTDNLGFFDGINRYFYDLSFRLRGTKHPSDQILIAAIDEKSLRELGQWPIKRSWYAAFLDAAHGARAVGISVIMSEPGADDAMLGKAVASHGRVVLPVYIDDRLHVVRPVDSFGHAVLGHIHVEEDVDGLVRQVFGSVTIGGDDFPALAVALQRIAGSPAVPPGRLPSPHAPGIHQRNPIQINFSGPKRTFSTVSFSDVVFGRISPEFLAGKIILVGVTAPGIAGQIETPFSHQRRRMSPVELHANLLNSLMQREAIQVAGKGISLALCLVMAVFWFVAFVRLSETRAAVLLVLSALIIAGGSFAAFSAGNMWLDPFALLLTASFLYITIFISRLNDAAERLKAQYSVIAGSITSHGEPPVPGMRFPGYLSIGGINEEIALLDKVVNQLVEQSAQLESVNSELEAFSYSVSHDLRSPLRAVVGFCNALEEDCAGRLDEPCQEYLTRISAAIGRMENLIEGLLRLSRLSRAELHREPVDLSTMVRDVAEELRKSDPGHPVSILVAEGVEVLADAALLRVVVTNLLENAWKFTKGNAGPVIEFGVERDGGTLNYYVMDNGAGFDQAHAEKLFMPFHRLHRAEDFPGTGIGLATVQRIVHRHGGRIWAEGKEGEGATFHFVL